MKDKLILVAGAGSGKLVPLFFGLYLARQFDGAALAGFVLVLAYGAALTSVANLGAAPRIIRAGAHTDSDAFIVGVAGATLLLALLALVPSTVYWLFVAATPFLPGTVPPGEVQAWVVLYALGLVLYTLAQSTLSTKGRYREAGTGSLLQHGAAAVAGVAVGLGGNAGGAVGAYFGAYCAGALLAFAASQRHLCDVWRRTGGWPGGAALRVAVAGSVSASLFGVITLAGFYFFLRVVQRELPVFDAATFALGFQLFQAGVFLPSVLGSIVVPKLVRVGREAGSGAADALHRRTALAYAAFGLAWVLAVLALAPLLLRLYALPAAGAGALVLMQVAAALAAIQAYFIQRHVAAGRFGLLALAALVWLAAGAAGLALAAPGLVGAVLALVLAYVACLVFYGLQALGRPE